MLFSHVLNQIWKYSFDIIIYCSYSYHVTHILLVFNKGFLNNICILFSHNNLKVRLKVDLVSFNSWIYIFANISASHPSIQQISHLIHNYVGKAMVDCFYKFLCLSHIGLFYGFQQLRLADLANELWVSAQRFINFTNSCNKGCHGIFVICGFVWMKNKLR